MIVSIQDGGSDKNHAPFSVGKTGNISRKFLTIILKIFDKNFERLQFLQSFHKAGKTLITITHNRQLAELLGTRFALMNEEHELKMI